jgi:hypothetical protein
VPPRRPVAAKKKGAAEAAPLVRNLDDAWMLHVRQHRRNPERQEYETGVGAEPLAVVRKNGWRSPKAVVIDRHLVAAAAVAGVMREMIAVLGMGVRRANH